MTCVHMNTRAYQTVLVCGGQNFLDLLAALTTRVDKAAAKVEELSKRIEERKVRRQCVRRLVGLGR